MELDINNIIAKRLDILYEELETEKSKDEQLRLDGAINELIALQAANKCFL